MQPPLSHYRRTGCPAGAASQNPYCQCSQFARTIGSQFQITAFSEKTRSERERTVRQRYDLLAILPNDTYESHDVARSIELTGSKRLRVDSWVKTSPVHTVPMTSLRAYRGYGPPTADFKLEQSSILMIEKLTGIQTASAPPSAQLAQTADEGALRWPSRPATSGTTAQALPAGYSGRTPTSYAARTPTYGTMTPSGSPRDHQADVFCSGDYTLCACDRCALTRRLHWQDIERFGSRRTNETRMRGVSRFPPSIQTIWRISWRVILVVTGAAALWGTGYGVYLLGKILVGWVLRVSHSISFGFASCVAAARAVWRFGSRIVGNIGSVLMRVKAGISWAIERVTVLVKALRRLGHWTP